MKNFRLISCSLLICCALTPLTAIYAAQEQSSTSTTADDCDITLTKEQLFALLIESRTARHIITDLNPELLSIDSETLEDRIAQENIQQQNILNNDINNTLRLCAGLTNNEYLAIAPFIELLHSMRTQQDKRPQLTQQLQEALSNLQLTDLFEILRLAEFLDLQNPLLVNTAADIIAQNIETHYFTRIHNNLLPVCQEIVRDILSRIPNNSARIVIQRLCARNGRWIHRQLTTNAICSADFSPDGNCIAICEIFGTITFLDHLNNRVISSCKTPNREDNTIWGCTFSPDGTCLATASEDKKARLWNPTTGQQIGRDLEGHNNAERGIANVAFSPDGSILASGGNDHLVCLWDIPQGTRPRASLRIDDRIVDLEFSRDGKLLAAADFNRTYLWDIATQTNLWAEQTSHDNGKLISDIALSPNQKQLAVIYRDATIQFFDIATGNKIGDPIILQTKENNGFPHIKFLPNGKLLAAFHNKTLVQINPETHEMIGEPLISGNTRANWETWRVLLVSPDGRYVAVGGGDAGFKTYIFGHVMKQFYKYLNAFLGYNQIIL